MADGYYLTRQEIAKFIPDARAQQRFDLMQRTVSDTDTAVTANLADTQSISQATYITLSSNAELPNERVLRWTSGLKVTTDDNFATISLTSDVPRSSGGYRITFTGEGDTSVGLPLTGKLATTDNTETLRNKTLDAPLFTGLAEYANDAAADAGGVPINGAYLTAGALKIRAA